jgi:hypothetical protein
VSTPVASRPGIRVITRENVHQQGELFDMPPRMQARVNLAERWRTTGNRFGDLSASAATAYRNKLMKGEVADWADLCEFWITSDLDLASLYSTRMDRIMDREWEVLPNEFGDPRLAQLAAEMCHELIARIENWNQALRAFAHAIASARASANGSTTRRRSFSTSRRSTTATATAFATARIGTCASTTRGSCKARTATAICSIAGRSLCTHTRRSRAIPTSPA